MTKFKKSNCDQTPKTKMVTQNSSDRSDRSDRSHRSHSCDDSDSSDKKLGHILYIYIFFGLKIVTKLKNSICDGSKKIQTVTTQNYKLLQQSKTQIVKKNN